MDPWDRGGSQGKNVSRREEVRKAELWDAVEIGSG